MKFKVTTAPAPVVTLAEAKAFLRVDSAATDEDVFISSTIAAATAFCETHSGRAFGTQTITLYLDGWPEDSIVHLPMPSLISVTSIKYTDSSGVLQTIDPANYQVDAIDEPGRVVPAPSGSWPSVQSGRLNAIEIEYQAGWGDAAALDPRAKEAILCLVAHWYTHREAVLTGAISKEIEFSVCSLLRQLWHGRLP